MQPVQLRRTARSMHHCIIRYEIYTIRSQKYLDMFGCIRVHLSIVLFIYKIKSFLNLCKVFSLPLLEKSFIEESRIK